MRDVIVVGMGVRDANDKALLTRLTAIRGATVAFLQIGDPSLSRELTRVADLGSREVLLIGASFGGPAPAQSWLRRTAAHWWREREDPPAIHVAVSLLKAADRQHLEALIEGTFHTVTGTEAGLESAAWNDVPLHRHQVLICRGPRCTARGSDEIAEALVGHLNAAGLKDDDVLVTQTGCQFPCNNAPVITVQPDDVWYGGVDDQSAKAIVTDHLIGGVPVERVRLRRSRSD